LLKVKLWQSFFCKIFCVLEYYLYLCGVKFYGKKRLIKNIKFMIFFKKKYLHNSLKNSIFVEQSMYTQPASQPASQPA